MPPSVQTALRRYVFIRYKELLDRKTLLEEREEVIRVEREKMEKERQAECERVKETERLREENER